MTGQPQERRRGKDSVGRERRLAELVDAQHGVVSRNQVTALGFPRHLVERDLRLWRLRPIHRGVYVRGSSTLTQQGYWLAAVLAYGDGAVLSHRSAAAHWGLVGRRSSRVDVTCSRGRAGRPGIAFHECKLHPDDSTVVGRIPVTKVARTLFDLSEVVDFRRLERAWEEADRLGLLEIKAMERVVERGYGRHALKPIRRLLISAHSPVVTRSALEDRFAAFCRERNLPPPATNVLLLGYEVDAYWPDKRVVVELDGFAYHRHHAAFERDRVRDATLQAAGYRVIRVTHRRLRHDANALAHQLEKVLGRA
jgi:hypothetical protein